MSSLLRIASSRGRSAAGKASRVAAPSSLLVARKSASFAAAAPSSSASLLLRLRARRMALTSARTGRRSPLLASSPAARRAFVAAKKPLVASGALRFFAERPAVYPEGSIYSREHENDIFRDVEFPIGENVNENAEFRKLVNELFQKYKPSKHSFFATLKNAPKEVATNPGVLNELYRRYQAGMHCTRAAVYMAPFLNSPTLRQKKVSIILDDDSQAKTSHHQQLENMFRSFGAEPVDGDYFGDLAPLADKFEGHSPTLQSFIASVGVMYPRTTGAWCIAEVLSDDWLSAFADSLSSFWPNVKDAEYFDEVFTGHVEIEHMIQTVALTEDVLARYPSVAEQTFADARTMCENLNALWDDLEGLIKKPEKYMS